MFIARTNGLLRLLPFLEQDMGDGGGSGIRTPLLRSCSRASRNGYTSCVRAKPGVRPSLFRGAPAAMCKALFPTAGANFGLLAAARSRPRLLIHTHTSSEGLIIAERIFFCSA